MTSRADASLHRAFRMLTDTALVLGSLLLVVGCIVWVQQRSTASLYWLGAACLSGLIAIAGRALMARYRPQVGS